MYHVWSRFVLSIDRRLESILFPGISAIFAGISETFFIFDDVGLEKKYGTMYGVNTEQGVGEYLAKSSGTLRL